MIRNIGKKILLVIAIIFIACCGGSKSGDNGISEKKNIEAHFKKFISSGTLESAGFEHFEPAYYSMLFEKDHLYILNHKDFLLAKFKENIPLKVYKTSRGQAPGEMIVPRSFFFHPPAAIAVYDKSKASILFFDLDLNYQEERKVKPNFEYVVRTNKGLILFLTYKHDDVFALADEHFDVIETFIKANKKVPFERFYPHLLNYGYVLKEGLAAHTYWVYPYKKCSINVYDIQTKKTVVTCSWEQPFTPNQKDINERKNLYSSAYFGKHQDFYVVQNSYSREMLGKKTFDLLVFDSQGNLRYRGNFPYRLIRLQADKDNANIYFMDRDEDISYINVNDILQ